MIPAPTADFWVFAYGSLMWEPNFAHAEARPALLYGYHRALCIYSHIYRGTRDTPGLVFGLDRGGAAKGMAFKVRAADAEPVLAYLYEREMVTKVYHPVWASCRVDGHGKAAALAFVADRTHTQYAGRQPEEDIIRLVRQGFGKGGACVDYVANTLCHLREMGIRDRALERLMTRLDD